MPRKSAAIKVKPPVHPPGHPAAREAGPVAGSAAGPDQTDQVPSAPPVLPGGKVVGAVVGAVKILRYLAAAGHPAGVSRIAQETRLNTSTTFNILRTLVMQDLVHFDQTAKTYALSLGLMEIARAATTAGSDFATIQPLLERIANKHGVTMTLWQPVPPDRKILIMAAHARSNMRVQMGVGQRLPLLIGSTGRIFPAFNGMTKAEIRRQFNAIRWESPLSPAEFMAQVDAARANGWAVDEGNFAAGTVSLSTGIFDSAGHVSLGVTATMFAGQFAPARVQEIVPDLKLFSAQVAKLVVL